MAPRLLVIDDEQDLLLLYQLILEPEGYDVHLAPSGLPAVMDLDHFLPDLILLDSHLGRRGRNEPLLQQLKAYPPTSATPLILCTADANALREQAGFLREAGVRVVLKPFSKRSRKQLLTKPRRAAFRVLPILMESSSEQASRQPGRLTHAPLMRPWFAEPRASCQVRGSRITQGMRTQPGSKGTANA